MKIGTVLLTLGILHFAFIAWAANTARAALPPGSQGLVEPVEIALFLLAAVAYGITIWEHAGIRQRQLELSASYTA